MQVKPLQSTGEAACHSALPAPLARLRAPSPQHQDGGIGTAETCLWTSPLLRPGQVWDLAAASSNPGW